MSQTDPILQLLVETAEAQDLNHGVTLYVNGLVISGEVCSRASFGESLEGKLERASGHRMSRREHGEEQRAASRPVEYVHLRNARVHFGSGPLPRNRGEHMRIRIDQVQGWMYGIINPG